MKNPKLKTIQENYQGNNLHRGRFTESYMSDINKSFGMFLRWRFTPNPKKKIKKLENYSLSVRQLSTLPEPERDYLIWMGHSSFLLHLNGKTLLTDPCLTAPPMMRRLAPLPLNIQDLALDYILVSHGHYDHLDKSTLAQLKGDSLTALVPLKLGRIINLANAKIAVQEAAWYQEYFTSMEVKITFLPSKHWNRRTLFDYNRSLWGSFLIQWKNKAIYFAGDTGYADHFQKIAGIIKSPIDYAILPIGAYDPSFIMQASHLNPEEALRAFQDLKAKRLIPMHYGTFDLSDEPLSEPIQWFKELIGKEQLEASVDIPDVGEIIYLD